MSKRDASPAGDAALTAHRDGVRAGDRRMVAKTITLLESRRAEKAELGGAILESLIATTGGAVRLGITGAPGVGKSTFIEALGLHLIGGGHKVAVLAVDPTSPRSRGSILGDKTRMERLAREENAFIRPSPSGGSLGGVAHRTREAMLVTEAAGFDVVIVETVGVGQSEAAVASMVDCFAVLLQPGAGDSLQGIKKGVLELADLLVVNKADGELAAAAERSRAEYRHALELLRPTASVWRPHILTTSAREGRGIVAFWELVLEQRRALEAAGELESRRREQARAWMWSLVREGLLEAFDRHAEVAACLPALEAEVAAQKMSPAAAARTLLRRFRGGAEGRAGAPLPGT